MENNKINLLIVDDEVEFLASISKSLEAREFNIIAVERGEKAIEAARKNPIDVALVDLKMPGINGEETLKALKAEHKWVEVVILTGHGTIDSAVECTQSGAFSYLQKPCSLEELLDSLKNAYKKKVMNRKKIEEKKMDKLLKIAYSEGPGKYCAG
jgi:DNA-binding NtrC family response regulator